MDQRFGLKGFVHITAAVVVIIIIIIIIIIRIQAAAAAAAAECYEHIVDAAATHRSTLPDVDAQCDKLAHALTGRRCRSAPPGTRSRNPITWENWSP